MTGFHRVSWLPCIWGCLAVLLVLNCLECFDRADFATNLAVALSIFYLCDTGNVSRD